MQTANYSLSYNLVVDTTEMKDEADELVERATVFETELGILATHIENIVDKAIVDGNAADNLGAFLDEVKALEKEAKNAAIGVGKAVVNYLTDIDKADGCVY